MEAVAGLYTSMLDAGNWVKTPFFPVFVLLRRWSGTTLETSAGIRSTDNALAPVNAGTRVLLVGRCVERETVLMKYLNYLKCLKHPKYLSILAEPLLRNCHRGTTSYISKVTCLGLCVNTYFGKLLRMYIP
jgi:hypothetical protein